MRNPSKRTLDDVLDGMERRRAHLGNGSWYWSRALRDGMKLCGVDNDEDLSDTVEGKASELFHLGRGVTTDNAVD